jgi:CRP/FNR family transcriptional regulator, cyclic AMP receptor protein
VNVSRRRPARVASSAARHDVPEDSVLNPGTPASERGWAQVLVADRDLAARLPPATVEAAGPLAVARVQRPEPGTWRPEPPPPEERAAHLGFLVLEGFFARHMNVLGRPATELLGRGDLLMPWEPDHTEPFAAGAHWEVLEPASVAVLDREFATLLQRWPEITVALVARAVARSRALALPLAIGQLVGVELRLLTLLWHLAKRWGTEDGEAIVLPVHLTHELLASLISAQRETVTRALGALGAEGLLSRREDGLYVLHGAPPARFRRSRGGV